MKIKKLRRALAVLLSAAMLIMCMPTVGITAAAVDDTTQCVYATITGTEDITTLSEVPAGTTWSDTVNLTAALAKANTAHDGDTVYIKLLSDVNKTNYGTYIQFSYSSGNVVLDLNGHTIDRGLTSATNGGKGIYISASDVMCITSSNGMGTITGGYESANEGSAIYSNSATKTIFSNIKISGNKNSGSRFGFSVIVRNGATVLDNVEITGNTDTGSAIVGGGIMTYYSNTLKNKVIIRDNSKYNFYCDLSSNAPLDISELSDDSEVCIFTDSMYSGRDITTGNPEKISLLKFDLTGYWLIPTVNGRITFTNSKYGVTFDMQGKADNQYKNVTKGGTVTKPTDPTAEGFTFGGWYTDKDCTDEFNFTTPITQNTTVYAKWEAPAGITITLDPNYTDAATSTATADEEGKLTEAQLAAPTRKDYVFMGWYDAKEGGKKVTADTVFTEDTTIYAQWVYYKLDNNIYTTLDEVKKQDIVKDMIDGETFDSVDLSGLFTINENSNCLTLSAVLTDKDEKTSGTYVGGEKYYALVTIKPETGFIFENIYNTRLFIGKTSYLSYNEDTTNNCVQFVYPIGRADFNYEEIVIDEVQVNVDTSKLDLIANEAIDPEAVYSCFSVP
ncbi:MAG: InlB B-repeat-containing protein, partial [Oscillospiraceae bacterium]